MIALLRTPGRRDAPHSQHANRRVDHPLRHHHRRCSRRRPRSGRRPVSGARFHRIARHDPDPPRCPALSPDAHPCRASVRYSISQTDPTGLCLGRRGQTRSLVSVMVPRRCCRAHARPPTTKNSPPVRRAFVRQLLDGSIHRGRDPRPGTPTRSGAHRRRLLRITLTSDARWFHLVHTWAAFTRQVADGFPQRWTLLRRRAALAAAPALPDYVVNLSRSGCRTRS